MVYIMERLTLDMQLTQWSVCITCMSCYYDNNNNKNSGQTTIDWVLPAEIKVCDALCKGRTLC